MATRRVSRKGIKEGKRLGEEEVHLPPLVPNPAYLGVHTYSSTIGMSKMCGYKISVHQQQHTAVAPNTSFDNKLTAP